jgi:hypothetical protein
MGAYVLGVTHRQAVAKLDQAVTMNSLATRALARGLLRAGHFNA